MAVAYSAIANGGRVVKPHIGMRVEDNDGRILQQIEPGAKRRIKVAASTRAAIMQGLRAAANDPGGTSTAVFDGFPITVAGKTGTAERPGQGDQSWYVAAAPANDPRIVIATTIERGGFGAEAAAPATRRILAAYFGIKGKKAIGEAGKAPD
jgi:penicillin-binding protein 2